MRGVMRRGPYPIPPDMIFAMKSEFVLPSLKSKIRYARMWPREIFDHDLKFLRDEKQLVVLGEPGVYVLYRDDVPYYVGQAKKLRSRLWQHAANPSTRYYNFWNFFSVFVPDDSSRLSEIEAILIAAMPTANSAKPKLAKEKFPLTVTKLLRKIRRARIHTPEGAS